MDPSRKTIANRVNLFRNMVTTQKTTSGSTKRARTPENNERVREVVARSPRRPSRKQALALHLYNTPLRRNLHLDLHFHPHKIQCVLELK